MSANEKMVMVPRELLERYVSSVESHNYGFDGDDEIRALLNAAPTHQGQSQGEPGDISDIRDAIIAKGELERRIAEMGAPPRLDYWYQAIFAADARIFDAMRARRARLCAGNGADQCKNSTIAPVNIDELTDEQIIEAMRLDLYAADGGYVIDMAEEHVVKAGRALLRAAMNPSRRVEINERLAPNPSAWRVSICGEWQYFSSYARALKERQDFESDFTEEDLEEARADGLCEPEPIYDRSALERKS